jgi:hypothetical protein
MSNARLHLVVSIVLAALVGLELALSYAHLPRPLTLAGLLVLAAAGCCGVVAFHMHLGSEPRGLKLLFVLPFVFPIGFGAAIVLEAWAQRGLTP